MIDGIETNLRTGYISRILNSNKAEIIFTVNDIKNVALLDKRIYFYNARLIPPKQTLYKYTCINMEVNFICVEVKGKLYSYIALMCWPVKHTLGNDIDLKPGMIHVAGRIVTLEGKQGILTVNNYAQQELEISFTLDRYFVRDEKLSFRPGLIDHLTVNENVLFDAIPCIPKEDKYGCEWYSTCVYTGKRPVIINIVPKSTNQTVTKVLECIENCFNNPMSMFITGRGKFMGSIDDDFDLILAKFQNNIFKEVIFHKKNVHVFKMCSDNGRLPNILKKGDEVSFIAVGSPPGFIIDWIALQVSICNYKE